MQSQQFYISLTETIKMISNKYEQCIAIMTCGTWPRSKYGTKINCRYEGMKNLYTLLSWMSDRKEELDFSKVSKANMNEWMSNLDMLLSWNLTQKHQKPNKMTRSRTNKKKEICSQRTIQFIFQDGAMIIEERLVKF